MVSCRWHKPNAKPSITTKRCRQDQGVRQQRDWAFVEHQSGPLSNNLFALAFAHHDVPDDQGCSHGPGVCYRSAAASPLVAGESRWGRMAMAGHQQRRCASPSPEPIRLRACARMTVSNVPMLVPSATFQRGCQDLGHVGALSSRGRPGAPPCPLRMVLLQQSLQLLCCLPPRNMDTSQRQARA